MAKIDREIKKFVKSYKTKKGLRWKVSIPDGHGGQIRVGGFISEELAIAHARNEYTKVLIRTNKMAPSLNGRITFGEYAEQWLGIKRQGGLSEITLKRYREQLTLHLVPYFGAFKMKEIGKHHLRNYISDSMRDDMSAYNLQNTVMILKAVLRTAIEDDLSSDMAILLVKTPTYRAKDPRFWDRKEMQYFLNAAKNSRFYELWKFVLWTGLRAGEVCALKFDCVHLDLKSGDHTGFIKVCRTVPQKSKVVRDHTKTYQNRLIPIFPEIREMLIEMKERATGDFVFGGSEPLLPAHLSRSLQADLRKIPELKRVTFHGLRHTFCSYLDSTGMNRRIVSQIMGHRELSTTDRYSHVSDQTMAHEVNRWLGSQIQQNSSKLSLVSI